MLCSLLYFAIDYQIWINVSIGIILFITLGIVYGKARGILPNKIFLYVLITCLVDVISSGILIFLKHRKEKKCYQVKKINEITDEQPADTMSVNKSIEQYTKELCKSANDINDTNDNNSIISNYNEDSVYSYGPTQSEIEQINKLMMDNNDYDKGSTEEEEEDEADIESIIISDES